MGPLETEAGLLAVFSLLVFFKHLALWVEVAICGSPKSRVSSSTLNRAPIGPEATLGMDNGKQSELQKGCSHQSQCQDATGHSAAAWDSVPAELTPRPMLEITSKY